MLIEEISHVASRWDRRPALSVGPRSVTYGELLSQSRKFAARLRVLKGSPVVVTIREPDLLIPVLMALEILGARALLPGPGFSKSQIEEIERKYDAFHLGKESLASSKARRVEHDPGIFPSNPGEVVLFTSGTTGPPKPVLHTWSTLAANIKRTNPSAAKSWLLTYPLVSFAGLQVCLQVLLNGDCLIVPEQADVTKVAALVKQHAVGNISGTPTFWRSFLMSAPVGLVLEQITLGGEIATQPVLSALRKAFPQAQITQVYAATELGVCFSVHDGRPGFPQELLAEGKSRTPLRIVHGELQVLSPAGRSASSCDGWIPTGDLVELRKGRVYFLGRHGEVINVGGAKVFPSEVEEEIQQVAGVEQVRVSGLRSSIMGQLVRAEVVPKAGQPLLSLKERIMDRCNRELADFKRPRLIEFVSALELSSTGKIARRCIA